MTRSLLRPDLNIKMMLAENKNGMLFYFIHSEHILSKGTNFDVIWQSIDNYLPRSALEEKHALTCTLVQARVDKESFNINTGY